MAARTGATAPPADEEHHVADLLIMELTRTQLREFGDEVAAAKKRAHAAPSSPAP